MKLIELFLISTLSAASHAMSAPDATAGVPFTITDDLISRLVVEARDHNPSFEAAGLRVDAASAAVDSVKTWEDPTLSLGFWRSSSRGFSSKEQGNIIYGVEEKLPVFGRPGLSRNLAEAEVAMARYNVDYVSQSLRHGIVTALLDLSLADKSVELARQTLRWLDATVSAVDGRYKVGKSGQVEWLKAQTERAKATDALRTFEVERDHQQVKINRVLNRDLHSPWPPVLQPSIAESLPFDDRIITAALGFAPKLKVMRQETLQSDAVARITKRQRLPEIGVGLQARQYSGDGGIREGTMTVNFTLPWVNGRHYDSDVLRDRAKVRAAERDAADYELEIREEVHHLTVDIDSARRQALLYRDELIPLTEQTLSSAEASWANSLGGFQDVLDAHRMLVEDQLILARSIADQASKRADLAELAGPVDPAINGDVPSAPITR